MNTEHVIASIDVVMMVVTLSIIGAVTIECKLLTWNREQLGLKLTMLFSMVCIVTSLIIMGVRYV